MNTEKKGNQAVSNTKDKTNHIGLWVSLSVAATAAVGVLAIAFYMDYQENKTKTSEPITAAISASSAPSAIPTSEAQAASIAAATSDRQIQGMTAPSDDGNNDADKAPASSAANTATASQPSAASQTSAMDKQAASDPAKTILGTENTINPDNQVVAPSNTTVNFYFAIGKADLAANTLESLKDLVAGVKNGKKAVILSHADAEANATLTKERAFAVRSVLLAAGVPENSIEVKEPTTGKSNSRLVQVILQ